MNPEMLFSASADAKRGDLSSKQKEQLARTWSELVVDNTDIPVNIGEMDQDEIKKWLFESTMRDIGQLAEEWGLQVDMDLVEKIKKAESLDEKSTLELEYIKKSHAQVDALTQKFDKSKGGKWDSWPKRMRATNQFNCVGATLLGINFLEKGGIKSYYGNPHEHVVNIVQLTNGEWWYIDFRNGKQNIIKIEPEEETINSVRVLKINQPEIDYKLIPIYDNAEAAGSVLGNLSALKHEAEDPTITDEDEDKKEAKKYLATNSLPLSDDELSSLSESLYPDFYKLGQTKAMQQEKSRIEAIWDFEEPIQAYKKSLTSEQLLGLTTELRNKKDLVERFIRSGDTSLLIKVSHEFRTLLELFWSKLESIQNKQSDIYKEAIERISTRFKNL